MVSVPLGNPTQAAEVSQNAATPGGQARRRRQGADGEFEVLPDSLPPQNLEAEEAVLGGILLDPDAIGRVADVLQPELGERGWLGG